MTVPSVAKRHAYAVTLAQLFGQDHNFSVNTISDVCDYVASGNEVDVLVLGQLMAQETVSMQLRTTVVESFPFPQHIPWLLGQYEEYKRFAFHGAFNHVDDAAWLTGALLRSMKPFQCGNAIIGHLLENAIRQRHNLPWRMMPCDKSVYELYHRTIFLKHFGKYCARK